METADTVKKWTLLLYRSIPEERALLDALDAMPKRDRQAYMRRAMLIGHKVLGDPTFSEPKTPKEPEPRKPKASSEKTPPPAEKPNKPSLPEQRDDAPASAQAMKDFF